MHGSSFPSRSGLGSGPCFRTAAAGLNSCAAVFLPKRNIPAGLNTCTSLFLAPKSTPSRRPSAGRLENSNLLWLWMLLPGSTPAPQYTPEECSGQAQHLHLTLPQPGILSESPAFSRSPWRTSYWQQLVLFRGAAAGLNSCTALFPRGMLRPGSTPAPHSSSPCGPLRVRDRLLADRSRSGATHCRFAPWNCPKPRTCRHELSQVQQ
jgi:hypothetical protein